MHTRLVKKYLRLSILKTSSIYFPVGEESLPSASKVSTDPSVLTDVGQLEALMRVQVMMAQLCRRGCQDYQTFCLSALGYCYHIWKVRVIAVGILENQVTYRYTVTGAA